MIDVIHFEGMFLSLGEPSLINLLFMYLYTPNSNENTQILYLRLSVNRLQKQLSILYPMVSTFGHR